VVVVLDTGVVGVITVEEEDKGDGDEFDVTKGASGINSSVSALRNMSGASFKIIYSSLD